MSLRNKRNSHQGYYGLSGGFSSKSMGSYGTPKARGSGPYLGESIKPVSVNTTLLTPLQIDIDPTIQAVRTQEKDQIKGLNNRFASLIDKVRFLEQQNKMLGTKWTLLSEQTAAPSNIEPMLKSYIANLQRQLDAITSNKGRLDQENNVMHVNVNDFKTNYEDEINKRNSAENDFVLLKKDVDAAYLSRVDLEDKVSGLTDELDFLKAFYDTELRELQESLKETSVVVEMDNSRGLNMDQIVSEVKAQYESIAARSRAEAENAYKTKFDQMSSQADQYSSELHSTKGEINELQRMISRLQNEIQAVKAQENALEGQMTEAEDRGEQATKDANDRIKELEQALQRAKQDMARQVREYQELMNIKLALDIEISTYRKLLEGEEERIGQQAIVSIQSVPNKTNIYQQSRSVPVLIKRMESLNRSDV